MLDLNPHDSEGEIRFAAFCDARPVLIQIVIFARSLERTKIL